MKFSSLTEKQVDEICKILEAQDIDFEVSLDSESFESNQVSLNNNLRLYNMSTLTDALLSVSISDESLSELSDEVIAKLSSLGVQIEIDASKIPIEAHSIKNFDEASKNPSLIMHEQNRNLTGHFGRSEFFITFLFLLVVGVVAFFSV